MQPTHVCEVHPRKDHRGVNLISDALSFLGCVTASQAQLGFQSALIVERLRGQGYGDFPGAVSTSSARPTSITASPTPYNARSRYQRVRCRGVSVYYTLVYVHVNVFLKDQKSNRRTHLPGYAAWEIRPVMKLNSSMIRVYDEAGNVIGIAGIIQSQLHVIFAA